MSFIDETNVSTSLSAQIKTQLDAKLSNCYMNPDNYTMVVEDIDGYLGRVISGARTAATPVAMLLPKEGFVHVGTVEYDYDLFDTMIANYDQKYYTFIGGFEDEHFIEILSTPELKDGLIYGGEVSLAGLTGFTFDITRAVYRYLGIVHRLDGSSVTLMGSEANDRIDVIYLDIANNVFGWETGIPAATPIKPQVNPLTQIELTTVYIPANATEPSEIIDETVFVDTVELTGDVTGSGRTGTPIPTTLATVNSNVGTFGSTTKIPVVTVNGKGLVTAASEVDAPTGGSTFDVHFIFDIAGVIVYPCPYAMKFTAMKRSQVNAPILSVALNTNMAEYDFLTVTADAAGLVTLTGTWL